MKENAVKTRSIELAVEIIYLYQFLANEKREYVLSKQLLRSGTSVGANVSEGVVSQSRKEFRNRLSIAFKESRETAYWLQVLCKTGYVSGERATPARLKCEEVMKLLFTILRTTSGKPD